MILVLAMKKMGFKELRVKLFKKEKKQGNSKTEEYRRIEEKIAKIMLGVLILVMTYPLIFWSGLMRWIGLLIDCCILVALYKAIFRDIRPVHIGMIVSPFWGRLPEYLPEGKHPVKPWDKIEEEELKVKVHTTKEEQGYFTLGGAPINLTVDNFYRIDQDNIYRYKEVEGTECDAMEGKVKEFLYTMIGTLETDEVVARQGEIAKGVLEEIRLHPISSKEKSLAFMRKKQKLLEGELKLTEKYAEKCEGKADRKSEIIDLESKIKDIEFKINKIKVNIEATVVEIDNLYEREIRKYEDELESRAKAEENTEKLKKIEKEIKKAKTMDNEELKKELKKKIEKKEEKALSELEEQFAIRILGSRTYGFDIADEEAKKGRSARTTAKFKRDAILTDWGTTDIVMSMLKKKYPDLSDSELLEAVLIDKQRIEKKRQVFEIEGLKEIIPEIAKAIFRKK